MQAVLIGPAFLPTLPPALLPNLLSDHQLTLSPAFLPSLPPNFLPTFSPAFLPTLPLAFLSTLPPNSPPSLPPDLRLLFRFIFYPLSAHSTTFSLPYV